jgi:hypothetical protein
MLFVQLRIARSSIGGERNLVSGAIRVRITADLGKECQGSLTFHGK